MKKNSGGVVAIAIAALVAIAVAVVLVTDVFGGDDDSTPEDPPGNTGDGLGVAIQGAAIVPGDDDGTQMAATVLDDGSHLYLLDLDSDEVIRWHSEFDSPAALYGPFAGTSDAVFMVASDRLLAWDRDTGEELFSIDLSDGVHPNPNGCHQCVSVFDDTLVVLTNDGILTGYDPADGDEQWTVEFDGAAVPPRQVLDFDGLPAVLTVGDDDSPELNVIDPTSGNVESTVALDCGLDDDGTGGSANDHLVALPDGGFFWHGTDSFESCAQRFGPGDTTPMWSTPSAGMSGVIDNVPSNFAVVDGSVAVADRDAIVWYDLESGDRSETALEGQDTAILGTADGVVYVGAEDYDDRGTWAITAIDAGSGGVAWEHDPGVDRLDSLLGVPVVISGWVADVVDSGLVVVTPDGDGNTLEVRVVSADDGTASDPIELDLAEYEANARPAIVGTDDERLIVSVAASVLVVDLDSGEVVDVTA